MTHLPKQNYKICTRCVMDTSDPEIIFDSKGVCNHCHHFDNETKNNWFPNDEGKKRLLNIIDNIKQSGQGKEYDCIMGLSGGLDSSYMALKVHEWGLRPLVVHVDAGWNSELAVANIESLVKYCGYHLHTHVVDWEEMRDLHLAYLKAGVANQDVPQDHVFFASMYHYSIANNIRYILSGGNIATESVFPQSWQGSGMDAINLKSIYRRFGGKKLKTYNTISFFQYYIWYPFVKKMRTIRPLNYLYYDKNEAMAELTKAVGWRSYDKKHGESQFTKLFQNHYLPTKFGFDKRRPHLSSLIMSDQITRDEAIKELDNPLYDPIDLERDIEYFCKKMRITVQEYEQYLKVPNRLHADFPNWRWRHKRLKAIQAIVENLSGRKIRIYS